MTGRDANHGDDVWARNEPPERDANQPDPYGCKAAMALRPRCGKQISGLFGAQTKCAKPAGHLAPHTETDGIHWCSDWGCVPEPPHSQYPVECWCDRCEEWRARV